MPTRTISTKLAIEGEAQYKAAIADINREYKTLESSLKRVESEFRNNANSIKALEARAKALSDVYAKQQEKYAKISEALNNARAAQEKYKQTIDGLAPKIADAEKKLEEYKNTTGDTAREEKKLSDELENLKKDLQDAEAGHKAASAGVENWQQKLNGAQIQLDKLSDEIDDNNKYLKEAENSADGCATSIDNLGKETRQAATESEDFGKKSKEAVDTLASVLTASGVKASIEAVSRAIAECAEASMRFESAMAGVAKTTDLSAGELDAMGESIKEMSTRIPLAASEIAGIAESAGQLGIAKENLLSFSEVMANLGVATNMSAEEAATGLARLANITGMPQESFDRLGSTIVDLGNNLATTESEITAMGLRLAGAGGQIGLTEANILSFAGALSSVGIEAEAGGSAFSKVMVDMQLASAKGGQSLEDFASVAGMTSSEFRKAFQENASGAIIAFIQGLGNVESKGKSAIQVLDDMGIKEVRMRDALLRAAGASDVFTKALNIGTNAWEANTALTKEAETRYGTTESKVKMLSNAYDNLKVAIGDQLSPALNNLTDIGAGTLDWLTEFIEQNDWLVPVLTAVTASVVALGVAFAAYTILPKITGLINNFMLALNAHPVMLIATAVAAVVTGLITLAATTQSNVKSVDELSESARALNDAFGESNDKLNDSVYAVDSAKESASRYITELEQLEKKGKLSADEQGRYNHLLRQLCITVPELAGYINLQTGSIEGGTKALRDHLDAWEETAKAKAYEETLTEQAKAYNEAQAELFENEQRLLDIQDEKAAKLQEHTDAQERAAEIQNELNSSFYNFDSAWQAAQQAASDAGYAYQDLCTEEENLTAAIEAGKEQLAEYGAQLDSTTDAARRFSVAGAEGVEMTEEQIAMLEQAKFTYDGIITEIDELNAAYEESYATAYENITQTCGLFNNMEKALEEMNLAAEDAAKNGIDDLIASLKSQNDYMDVYAINIQKAMHLGVEQGLLQELSDGSVESAKILASIVASGKDNIDKLNTEFDRTEEGKESFSRVVAGMETDFKNKMDGIEEEINDAIREWNRADEMAGAGRDTVQGYINGLNDKLGALRDKADEIARIVAEATERQNEINSPSERFRRIGGHIVDGWVLGLRGKEGDLAREAEKMARLVIDNSSIDVSEINAKIEAAMPRVYNFPTPAPIASRYDYYSENTQPVADIAILLDGRIIGEVVTPIVSRAIATDISAETRGMGII